MGRNTVGTKSHILAAKVRYVRERFEVGLVINKNNGKYFYDHKMTEINAVVGSVSEKPNVKPAKASVMSVVRKSLLSSGFDEKKINTKTSGFRLR